MSRNRGSTKCACGLWDFQASDDRMPLDTPGMETGAEYWGDNSRYADMGYGFRRDCEGTVYSWRKRNADGGVTALSSSPAPGYTPEVAWTYRVPVPTERYRWRYGQCPLCRRRYALWYVQQPASLDPPCWEVYDTSYYHAHNDEPATEDVEDVVEWTPAMLAEAAWEYLARRALTRPLQPPEPTSERVE